jgi:hypothetical protein
MNNLNKITRILGTVLVLATSSSAMADQDATGKATIQVLNTFEFLAVSDLDFGIVRATADDTSAGDVATLLISGDPTVTSIATDVNLAKLTVLTEGSPAEFTVAGVAAFANLTITLPSSTITLVASGLPGTAANFKVGTFTAWLTSGGNTGLYDGASNKLLADNSGNATFNVGATLTTDEAGDLITQGYEDDIPYAGSFDVTIEY